jgi:hypothetical protein
MPRNPDRNSRPVTMALVVIAVLAVLSSMRQSIIDRFVYYPMAYPEGEWDAQAEAGAQDVWLTTEDGIRLNAWWFAKPE